MVQDYNSHMGYFDKADMLKSLYEVHKKMVVQDFVAFYRCYCGNAHIIYKDRNPNTKMNLKAFRLALVDELIGYIASEKRQLAYKKTISNNKTQILLEKRYLQTPHIPAVLKKRRRCVCCSSKSKQKVTLYYCTTCNVPLCLNITNNCFQIYHKQ